MTQYIGKNKIKEEIERLIDSNKSLKTLDPTYYEGLVDSLDDVLSFLDTLEVKEVDLEQISKQYALNNSPWDDCWPEVQDAFKTGFELGLKAQKGE